jgi:hypothetical protein
VLELIDRMKFGICLYGFYINRAEYFSASNLFNWQHSTRRTLLRSKHDFQSQALATMLLMKRNLINPTFAVNYSIASNIFSGSQRATALNHHNRITRDLNC